MTFFHGNHAEPNPIKESNRSYFTDAYTHRVRAAKPSPPPVSQQLHPQEPRKLQPTESQPRADSKLSNVGQRSLQLDQVGVYHKQTSPYNIISCKPKEYSDDIRQYPWYSVENRDDVYYKRMNESHKESQFYNTRAKTHEKAPENVVAGKHTYGLEPKISYNPEQKPKKEHFTAKMLNHMDELQHNLA